MKDYYQTYENATKCPWQVYSKNSLLLVNSFLHILFQHYLPVTVRGWDLFDNAYDEGVGGGKKNKKKKKVTSVITKAILSTEFREMTSLSATVVQ